MQLLTRLIVCASITELPASGKSVTENSVAENSVSEEYVSGSLNRNICNGILCTITVIGQLYNRRVLIILSEQSVTEHPLTTSYAYPYVARQQLKDKLCIPVICNGR